MDINMGVLDLFPSAVLCTPSKKKSNTHVDIHGTTTCTWATCFVMLQADGSIGEKSI